MPPPPPPPAVYTDHASLISDMQLLLTDPTLCDATILVADDVPVAVPSQILSARSPYFAALLSPRWHRPPPHRLRKPNAPLPVFHDVVEYLVTGAVTLSLSPHAIAHNVRLAVLSDELALARLHHAVVAHIAAHLALPNLALYLRAIRAARLNPPPALHALLCRFLRPRVQHITPALVAHDWHLVHVLWRIVVNIHAQQPLTAQQLAAFARALIPFSTLRDGEVRRLPQLLAEETPHDRHLLLAVLLDASPLTFSALVAPAAFYSDQQLLAKYRADALRTCPAVHPTPRPRWRVLCESDHPHHRAAVVERTARRVVLPVQNPHALCDSLIRFDRRTSLGDGAELTFYVNDPATGVDPITFIVGTGGIKDLVIPGTDFWFAFSSADREDDPYGYYGCRWGWRFIVEPVPLPIDAID